MGISSRKARGPDISLDRVTVDRGHITVRQGLGGRGVGDGDIDRPVGVQEAHGNAQIEADRSMKFTALGISSAICDRGIEIEAGFIEDDGIAIKKTGKRHPIPVRSDRNMPLQICRSILQTRIIRGLAGLHKSCQTSCQKTISRTPETCEYETGKECRIVTKR